MTGSQDRALVYVDGALVPRDEAKVSIFDGGFVVGDGIWEGLRHRRSTVAICSPIPAACCARCVRP
jgi:branched-subunit amino acid aminotransferase/4-amino-4-deoxychorismate lyase